MSEDEQTKQAKLLTQIEQFCAMLTEWTTARAELEACKASVPPDLHGSMDALFAKLDAGVSVVVQTAEAVTRSILALPADQSAFIKPAMAKFNAIVVKYDTARRLATPPELPPKTPEASAQI